MVGAVKLMNESPPDLRPALAYLKAVASEDAETIRVLTEPDDLLEIVEGLADLVLLFIEDLSDNSASHIDLMFQAVPRTVSLDLRVAGSSPARPTDAAGLLSASQGL